MKRRNLLKSLGLLVGYGIPSIEFAKASTDISLVVSDNRKPYVSEVGRCRADIGYFAEKHFFPAMCGSEYKSCPKQLEILRAMASDKNIAVHASPRTGKTALSLCYVYWKVRFHAETPIEIVYATLNETHAIQIARLFHSIIVKLPIDASMPCLTTHMTSHEYRVDTYHPGVSSSISFHSYESKRFRGRSVPDEIVYDESSYYSRTDNHIQNSFKYFKKQPRTLHLSSACPWNYSGDYFQAEWLNLHNTRMYMRWTDVSHVEDEYCGFIIEDC
jgi:hypothetical protein